MPLALNQVHQGDCLALLSQIEDQSVHLAFADPPFNIGYQYDVYQDRKSYDDYLEWSRRWMREVCRVLRPDGTFWLAIGDEYAAELKVIARQELALACRSWVVWYYTFGVNCKRKFNRSHAHLFHFVKDENRFTFNADDPAVRVPSARQTVYADRRAHPTGRLPDDTWILPAAVPHGWKCVQPDAAPGQDGAVAAAAAAGAAAEPWILRPQDLPDGFAADGDTWYFPRVAGTFKERAGFHGCQMPEQLLGRIIRACSNPGDVVLDPMSGSGTTLAAAKKLGRRWLGIELSPQYAAQIRARLDSISADDPLDGAADPLRSVPATPGAAAAASNGKPARSAILAKRAAAKKNGRSLF
jgi:DNA modification methylase